MNKLLIATLVLMVIGCSTANEEKSVANDNNGVFARMKTTKGEILIKLEFEKVPLTVANFVGLAEGVIPNSAKASGTPFYDGIIFHRVINGFMLQCGDPEGTGRGGPGYRFKDEFDNSLKHTSTGILSMANSGPGTNGSQFFITHKATPHLDNRHTVFGKVIEGIDVVNTIATTPTAPGDRPIEEIKIETIVIERKGALAKKFTKESNVAFTNIIAIANKSVAAKKNREEKQREVNANMKNELKKKYPSAQEKPSGLMYIVDKAADGEKPKPGTKITVHYTGKLLDGSTFDSSLKRGKPFQFVVGEGMVIAGWDEGLMDMAKGEKRTLIIPPELGYGSRGAGGVIPPDAWLLFEVELIDF